MKKKDSILLGTGGVCSKCLATTKIILIFEPVKCAIERCPECSRCYKPNPIRLKYLLEKRGIPDVGGARDASGGEGSSEKELV